ncbi:MAG: hypothetical protein GEV28_11085 [Actinophytocola sp.]|uniref:hypothetical protein n=1 Tax=Actinophytocola sp. TaxID=1872138 RepID=UPI0013295877|nr:hypothetical protein [Actinophytocola sp.]MPZ80900.1 hypothetical protein [Actinophytocola sp.]
MHREDDLAVHALRGEPAGRLVDVRPRQYRAERDVQPVLPDELARGLVRRGGPLLSVLLSDPASDVPVSSGGVVELASGVPELASGVGRVGFWRTSVASHLPSSPRDDTAMPGDDTAMPRDDTAMPRDDTAMPGDDTAMPRDDTAGWNHARPATPR